MLFSEAFVVDGGRDSETNIFCRPSVEGARQPSGSAAGAAPHLYVEGLTYRETADILRIPRASLDKTEGWRKHCAF